MSSPTLNLGVLAHVDAGKTSLTERLLYAAGVIDRPGRVDAGTTATDSMDLEQRRGITIRTAVAAVAFGDLQVNLVDTPGHPDFIAEVERALAVLDGAVLVLSAVEGVQPQTVMLWRALRRLAVPTLFFVNKVDRAGADPDRVVADIGRRLDPHVFALSRVADGLGTAAATVVATVVADRPEAIEALAAVDDRVLDAWVDEGPVTGRLGRDALRRAVAGCRLSPALVGSAVTGAGADRLIDAVIDLLPPGGGPTGDGGVADDDEEPAGTVFAVDRDAATKRAWVRVWSGRLETRQRIELVGDAGDAVTRAPARVTGIEVHAPGGPVEIDAAGAGQIALVRGWAAARIGDHFGPVPDRRVHRFPPATLEAVVEPVRPEQRIALRDALDELAERDPLIAVRTDGDQVAVRLFGEVQKEVLAALLAEGHGIDVVFRETSVVCIERVTGRGEAVEHLGQRGNPYLATVGLRIEPAPIGHGVEFRPGIEPGRLVAAFVAATEEAVRRTLGEGRHGWEVPDAVVTMTASRYFPRQSHAHQRFDKSMSSVGNDFRSLAPVVLMAALRRAGTVVCEPIHRFELEVPVDAVDGMTAHLTRHAATIDRTDPGRHHTRLGGVVPAARLREVVGRLPDLARGEAVFTSELDHHRPVTGDPPTRRRTGLDPADRDRWFRDVPR